MEAEPVWLNAFLIVFGLLFFWSEMRFGRWGGLDEHGNYALIEPAPPIGYENIMLYVLLLILCSVLAFFAYQTPLFFAIACLSLVVEYLHLAYF